MTIEKKYGIPETANVLGVCYETLRQEIKRGAITTVQIGRRKFITESAISAYLNARTRPMVAA
jgi:excisionase family DNA binding protein